jgi:hypothetical protein
MKMNQTFLFTSVWKKMSLGLLSDLLRFYIGIGHDPFSYWMALSPLLLSKSVALLVSISLGFN